MLCLQIQIFQIDGDYDEDSLKFRGLEQTMDEVHHQRQRTDHHQSHSSYW